ncbi:hypothetical protein ACFQ21_07455 [Ohtaekwangia kribbensis]|uniref:50S ribosomal protein L29 n=1 Tax=Ohtaekwangia kribbensis TaxID=688913 RepID=A0ABW3JYT2_9BACT
MKLDNLSDLDRENLLLMIAVLQEKLKRKNDQLHRTQIKLNTAKGKLTRMKDTVAYQRKRLLELYQ